MQVEQNVEFVQKRRDDVTFSPKDQATIDSFLLVDFPLLFLSAHRNFVKCCCLFSPLFVCLQLEKSGGNTPFSQYYASVLQKFNSQNLVMNEKTRYSCTAIE